MLSKLCQSETDSLGRSEKKRFNIFSKMTAPGVSSYERMDDGVAKKKKKRKMKEAEDVTGNKENDGDVGNAEVKVKKAKKKRSWKTFRQAALTTCRYLGMGAAHMSPGTAYCSPDYYMDPKTWDRSFSHSYKQKVPTQRPHWSSTVMFTPGF